MKRLEIEQILKNISNNNFKTKFANLYALKRFLDRSIIPNNYVPNEKLCDSIILSKEGEKWLPIVQKTVNSISAKEAKLAIFITFFHKEIFVDLNKTDFAAMKNVFHEEMLVGNIRFPWVYEHCLYDNYFEIISHNVDKLSYEDSLRLLEKCPQGVFQIRDIVVGPFGVLHSLSHRFLDPVTNVPLWHCSDPTCFALHPVNLSKGDCKVFDAVKNFKETLYKEEGPPSEWNILFRYLNGSSDHYDDMNVDDFPWLLANAYSEGELRCLLKSLIDKESKAIRKQFLAANKFRDVLSGSSEEISKRLSKSQCLQLILLMPDNVIIQYLESLIDQAIIRIPPTEIRDPVLSRGRGGYFNITSECSNLGVRFISKTRDISLARLKRLIKTIYKDGDKSEQLSWVLRKEEGESPYEKLDRYLHLKEPRAIVNDLLLSNKEHLTKTLEILKYGLFSYSYEQEDKLINKILWKLGFDVKIFPTQQIIFWDRYEKFIEKVNVCQTYGESEKAIIRSEGVNLFVSLEEILDLSLSFSAWALLSDHFAVTKFRYCSSDARQLMASCLNGRRIGEGRALELNPNGKNTLYHLICGFKALADYCEETLKGGSAKYQRPKEELPGFFNVTDIETFPFLHKRLIFDLREIDVNRIVNALKDATDILEKSSICEIRNRIDHGGREFPNREEIVRACQEVKRTINLFEESGICPLVYFYFGSQHDSYGRKSMIFKNCRGKEIKVFRPSQFNACGIPSLDKPLIFFPYLHVDDSFEIVRYGIEENSDFKEIWENYPKRRKTVVSDDTAQKYIL
jgi:hypothetical protein